jgi:hypothetical protein
VALEQWCTATKLNIDVIKIFIVTFTIFWNLTKVMKAIMHILWYRYFNGWIYIHVFQIGDVRSCCLRALYPLYETEDLSPKLELFTNRFKVNFYGFDARSGLFWLIFFIKSVNKGYKFGSLLSTQPGVRTVTGLLGIKIMCPCGATCLPVDCSFSELALKKSNSMCWSSTIQTSLMTHSMTNLAC